MVGAKATLQFLNCIILLSFVAGLPGSPKIRQKFIDEIEAQGNGSNWFCFAKECTKPKKAYERILPAQPGNQWMNDGGYCGSWSLQRSVLLKGAWISQAQFRAHAKPGGGFGTEILATNIDGALQALKLKYTGFDYKNLPTPQADAYRKWIKQSLVAGNAVVWMIMQPGEGYPVYPHLPNNSFYGHIEPVVGILSDHPLNDTQWYDDDYIVHFTDVGFNPYYRSMASLPETEYNCGMEKGNCHSDYTGYPNINNLYGFGWSIEGLQDETNAMPVSLAISGYYYGSEPEGSSVPLTGTLTISGLSKGTKYAVNRWDSVEAAFDYTKPHSVHRFVASGETETYVDTESIPSAGTTYYRCIEDGKTTLVV